MAEKSLVIVESPAKAKTIEKYLGKDFQVLASMGHLRDLPKSSLSVDVKNDFEPVYQPIKGKEEIIKSLKKSPRVTEIFAAPGNGGIAADAICTGIRELEEHGYLERRRLRDGFGRLAGTEYVVHERAVARPSLPESDEPALGFPMQVPPAQERPALANPRQLSKEKSRGAGPRARRDLSEYACVAGDVL